MQTPSQFISMRAGILSELATDLIQTSPPAKIRTALSLFAEEMGAISHEVLQLNREFRVAPAPSPYNRYLTVEAQRPNGEWESVLSHFVCENVAGAEETIRVIRAGELGTRF